MSTFFISCSLTRANSSFTAVTFSFHPLLSDSLRQFLVPIFDSYTTPLLLLLFDLQIGGRKLICAAFATVLVLVHEKASSVIAEMDTLAAHALAATLLANEEEEYGDADDDDALSPLLLSSSLLIKGRHPRIDLVLVLLLRYTYCCWRNLLLYPKRQLSVRLTSRARALVFSPSASSSSLVFDDIDAVSMPFLFSLPFESARGTSEETGNRAFRVNICVCVFCVQFLISLFSLSFSLFVSRMWE